MNVPRGAIYGLVGKNGAGKTTLIRVICGLQEPTAGDYTLYGARLGDKALHRARRRMGAVVETPLPLPGHDRRAEPEAPVPGAGPAGGQRHRRAVGAGGPVKYREEKGRALLPGHEAAVWASPSPLCGDPDFLVLDEPTNGLDPQGIVEMRELILQLNRERQITVLISSHILDELAKLATHYGFLDGGQLVRQVTAQEVEAACRKCLRATVTDAHALCLVLDQLGLPYAVTGEKQVDIYQQVNVTQLVEALSQKGCQLLSLKERDESLESYYINLVGGERHG